MIRICSALCIAAALSATGAQAADKKKAEPQPKTIVDVVGDILMAPVKLVEDLTKPAPAKPAKK
jgi:hypothetical protein